MKNTFYHTINSNAVRVAQYRGATHESSSKVEAITKLNSFSNEKMDLASGCAGTLGSYGCFGTGTFACIGTYGCFGCVSS